MAQNSKIAEGFLSGHGKELAVLEHSKARLDGIANRSFGRIRPKKECCCSEIQTASRELSVNRPIKNWIFIIWFRSKLVTHKKSLGDKIVRTMRTTKKIKAPPKPSDEDTESDQVSYH